MTPHHLADYLESTARQHPHNIAVVDPGGDTTSYSALDGRANSVGAHLVRHAVGAGDRIAVGLPKSAATLAAFFGVLKSGAAYVPIDPSAPVSRIRQILEDCQTTGAILSGRIATDLQTFFESRRMKTILVDSATEPPAGSTLRLGDLWATPSAPPAIDRRSDSLAYIIYTSGSTGTPKGVMITHGNAIAFLEWCSTVLQPSPTDRFGSHTPFHFDASVQDIYPAIKHGASMHLISEDLAKHPKDLVRFIEERRLTIWASTPSALIFLLQFGELEKHPADSLRVVSFGGEVFPVRHLRELVDRWRSPVYFNMYGPTETTTTCTFARIPKPIPADRDQPFPIGFPCSHCQAIALDEDGHEVGPHQDGVLHVGGPSVFAGYWNRPEESAAVLVERRAARWYNTGDVVRWDPHEGFTFVGRRDRMVKRRGYRIELAEIEGALYSSARVREAAVIATQESDAGVRITAFLHCSAPTPTIVEMKALCAKKLPPYMSPDRFVFRDELPKTSTGKVDYRALTASL